MDCVLPALDIPHRPLLLILWLHRDDGVPSLAELRVSMTCPIQWSASHDSARAVPCVSPGGEKSLSENPQPDERQCSSWP